MKTNIEHFKTAWETGELFYPEDPPITEERWFLRAQVNEEKDNNIVFIGINPSKATVFNNGENSDPTIKNILELFPLNDDDSPRDYRQMTIINLIPRVGQSPSSKTESPSEEKIK